MEIDNRKTSTILAALRLWQQTTNRPGALLDIASGFDNAQRGPCEPLTVDEISALCEELNLGEPTIEDLLEAYGEALFKCGQWDRDESEESYDAVHSRAETAKEAVLAAIAK